MLDADPSEGGFGSGERHLVPDAQRCGIGGARSEVKRQAELPCSPRRPIGEVEKPSPLAPGSREQHDAVIADTTGDRVAAPTRQVDGRSLDGVASDSLVDRIAISRLARDQPDENAVRDPWQSEIAQAVRRCTEPAARRAIVDYRLTASHVRSTMRTRSSSAPSACACRSAPPLSSPAADTPSSSSTAQRS